MICYSNLGLTLKMSAEGRELGTRLVGFEPTTPGSEDRCSGPLSYRRKINGVSGGIRTLDIQGHNLAPLAAGLHSPSMAVNIITKSLSHFNKPTVFRDSWDISKYVPERQLVS